MHKTALRSVDLSDLEESETPPHAHRELKAGEVLFCEGDQGDFAYIIESGLIEITRHINAVEVTLATCGPGDLVGEMALIDDSPRSATVRALKPTRLEVLPKDEFQRRLADTDPAVQQMLMRFVGIIRRMTDSTVRLTLGIH